MKRHDILIGVIVVGSIIALVYYFFFYDEPQEPGQLIVEDTGPQTLSIEESIEDTFNLQIPENAERAELRGASDDMQAIATREIEGRQTFLTILASLPDGKYYAAVIKGTEGNENFDILPIGELRIAKGGYLVEFQSSTDLNGYDRVIVSREPIISEIPTDLVFDGGF